MGSLHFVKTFDIDNLLFPGKKGEDYENIMIYHPVNPYAPQDIPFGMQLAFIC